MSITLFHPLTPSITDYSDDIRLFIVDGLSMLDAMVLPRLQPFMPPRHTLSRCVQLDAAPARLKMASEAQ